MSTFFLSRVLSCVLSVCAFSSFSYGAGTQTYSFPWNEQVSIEILGSDLSVVLSGNSAASLQIKADDNIQVSQSGDHLKIRSLDSGATATKGRIEIIGKPTLVSVHLLEGSILSQKWTRDANFHLQKGKLISKESSGTLSIHIQKGDFSVFDHQGKVAIDNFQTNGNIKNLNGDLELQNFLGDIVLDKPKGSLVLNANQGSIKLLGGSGNLVFDGVKAQFISQFFQGRIEGQSVEGSSTIHLANEEDLHFKTQSGKVSVQTLNDSGALLNMACTEGEIYLPTYLKVSRDGSSKSFRGRLKGEIQKNSIVLRSTDGVLTVK